MIDLTDISISGTGFTMGVLTSLSQESSTTGVIINAVVTVLIYSIVHYSKDVKHKREHEIEDRIEKEVIRELKRRLRKYEDEDYPEESENDSEGCHNI